MKNRRGWGGLASVIALVLALNACQATDGPADLTSATPIPSFTKSEDNCAVWSCSSGQCSRDPAIYGPCCVQVTEGSEPGVPKGSCGGSPYPQQGSCGPSNGHEIYGAGCYCDAEYSCCYWQNPTSIPFEQCNTFN